MGILKAHRRENFATAKVIAVECGHLDLVSILEPEIRHPIPAVELAILEGKVNSLMKQLAGNHVSSTYYPHFRVLTRS